MGLDVAAEIRDLGHVKNTECIKCHICIGACPTGVLETSFKKNSFHKNGQPAGQTSALSGSISLLQAGMAIIVLILFGFDVGGNISLSLGFLAGFLLIHVWHSRSITLFEAIISVLVVVGLYFKDDMNDPVSLANGLLAIAVFLIAARTVGFEKGFAFINKTAPSLQTSRVLMAVVLAFALFLGVSETRTSILIHKANAARRSNDTGTYATIMESCAGAHSDPAGAYFDLAKAQLKINEPQKAARSLKKSLDLMFSAKVAIEMYELLRTFGNSQVAEEFAAYLMSTYPEVVDFVFLNGSIMLEKKDFVGAENLYRGVIAKQPDNHDGYIAMGELRLQQSRIDEAEEFFSRAYTISPASSAFYMADICFQRQEYSKAESFYAEAVSKNPPNVVYLMDQGGNFAAQNKLRDAINTWKKALEIAPDLSLARENIDQAEAALAAKKAAILGDKPESE
jgi:tetratricopeptide (TPR) repeat protein